MGLSRLSKKCQACRYVNTCDHNKLESLAYMSESFLTARSEILSSVLQPHNYREIYIDKDTKVTIDLEEIKENINKTIQQSIQKTYWI